MKWVEQIQILGALVMVIGSMAVLSYLAIMGHEQAQGALIAVLAAGTSYFLRGKVEKI